MPICSLIVWKDDPASQEGRQAVHWDFFFFFLNSCEWNSIDNKDQHLESTRSGLRRCPSWGCFYRGRWPILESRVWDFRQALCRVRTAHLTLELVRMKGPVQIHGLRRWSHFASDAVHVIVVVHNLNAERSRQRGIGQPCWEGAK